MYKIPSKYYFRLHHVRPRFKGDVENVLIFLAEELRNIGELSEEDFREQFNRAIFRYPGNAHRELKTINNWRTEISSLFGFIEHIGDKARPGLRAIELAEKKDLVQFFKTFLFNFQYPGAHIKPLEVQKQILAKIRFKPAQYILKLLKYACEKEKTNIGITKYEVCHCIFNDLRCTSLNEDVAVTWQRISENRGNNAEYDQTGDVIRYAGDIIDYMEMANLLKTYDSRTYYLNTLEEEAILKFTESTEWFSGYDKLYRKRNFDLEDIKVHTNAWFEFVNRPLADTDFSTDILAFIAEDADELSKLQQTAAEEDTEDTLQEDKACLESEISKRLESGTEEMHTKDIGDIGEHLVHGHECMRIKLGGREDLIHLIKRIPTQFCVGYDISSVELDERKRYIEVKTTISSKPLHFNKIHLTKNEWNTASSTKDRYYVYRLMISKKEKILFLLQDPVGLYKQSLIEMVPDDGAEITFNPQNVGHFEPLLTWHKQN